MSEGVNHRQFLKSLPAQDRKALVARNNLSGLIRLCLIVPIIALLVVGIANQVVYWPWLMLPLGVLWVLLFTLMHETTHKTAFATQWLNSFLSKLCGLIIIMPPCWFESFHFAHHRHTHSLEKDPEMAYRKPNTLGEYVWFISGLSLAFSQIKLLFSNAFTEVEAGYISHSDRSKVRREARLMLSMYFIVALLSIYFQSTLIVTAWLIPLLLGQPFLRLFLLAEHYQCPNSDNMFANTRTTYTNGILRFFTWNMSYHIEHHVLPAAPFHQLAAFHQLTKPHCEVLQEGYWNLHKNWIMQYLDKA